MSDSELSNIRRLDAICDEFENKWNADARVDLNPWLEHAESDKRSLLLRMLLDLDYELRAKSGQSVAENDYQNYGQEAVVYVRKLLNESPTRHLAASPSESPTADPASVKTPSKQIGPYKLLQQIGEGGMGTVWMAEQEKPVRRRVALKLIRSDVGSKTAIARFEAERQALAMMDHQNIAKVLDAGTTETGNPFFVMELVEGIPINEYCDQNKLTPDERLELFVPVCNAVQHAHQKGIIHRDLKPSNVLVQIYDGKPIAKVIDFGLAKALEHTTKLTDKTMFTEFGQVVGTLQYMSPEQATMDALTVDTRTDIYSLGVMLYEVLAGSTPIEKKTLRNKALLQVLEVIREKEPPKPSHRLSSSGEELAAISRLRQIHPGKLQQILRGELDWIVMKSLEKDRTRRYKNANDLAQDIKNYLNGDAVEARPPSTSYLISKFVRKNSAFVAMLFIISFSLIAGICGTSWFAYDANAARLKVEEESRKVKREKTRADDAAAKAKVAAANAIRSEKLAKETTARSRLQLGVAQCMRGDSRNGLGMMVRAAQGLANDHPLHDSALTLLQSWCELENRTFFCPDRIESCLLSPDGSRALTKCVDESVYLWNCETNELIAGPISCKRLVFGFDKSGDRFYVQDTSKLKFFNSKCGDFLWESARAFPGIYFSADEKTVAIPETSKSRNSIIRLRNVETGKEVHSSIKVNDLVYKAASICDGQVLVTSGIHRSLDFWSMASGKRIGKPISSNGASSIFELKSANRLIFKDGLGLGLIDTEAVEIIKRIRAKKFVAPSNGDCFAVQNGHRITIINALNGKRLAVVSGDLVLSNPMQLHSTSHLTRNFSADGRYLFFDNGGRGNLVESKTGKVTEIFSHGELRDYLWSPDSKLIALATSIANGSQQPNAFSIQIWDRTDGELAVSPFTVTDGISSIHFTPDSSRLVTTTMDGKLRFFDVGSGLQVGNDIVYGSPVEASTIDNSGSRVLVHCTDRTAHMRNISQSDELQTEPNAETNYYARCISVSDDGLFVATASNDWTARIWKVAESGLVDTGVELQHGGTVNAVVFLGDSHSVATASDDRSVRVWNWSNNTSQPEQTLWHGGKVLCLGSYPDGQKIISGASDGLARIWDLSSGDLLATLNHDGPVLSLAVSRDGSEILSGSADETARRWDANSFAPIGNRLRHDGLVRAVDYHPQGQEFVTATSSIRIWDKSTQVVRGSPLPHSAEISSVNYSEDGLLLAVSTIDNKVQLWETGSLLRAGPPLAFHSPVLTARFLMQKSRIVAATYNGKIMQRHTPVENSNWKLATMQKLIELQTTDDTSMERFQRLTFGEWKKRLHAIDKLKLSDKLQFTPSSHYLRNRTNSSQLLLQKTRQAGAKLRTIVRGLHSIEHEKKDIAKSKFPSRAILGTANEPLLSWRVHILPALGMQELYDQFKLDQTWDSQENIELIEQIPDVYRVFEEKSQPAGNTKVALAVGKSTLWPDFETNPNFMGMIDGTANTAIVAILNGRSSIPWTKPEDWQPGRKGSLELLDKSIPGFGLFGFADGSTGMIPTELPEEFFPQRILMAYFNGNDGLPVPFRGEIPTRQKDGAVR